MNDVIRKERNKDIHIISNIKQLAFAWAAYYANQSNIFICGTKYHVDVIINGNVQFSDGKETGFGNYVIFRNCKDSNLLVFQKECLSELRTNNPITGSLYCFSDETFMKS